MSEMLSRRPVLELSFGLRMDVMGDGVSFYGIDEINDAIEAGALVTELRFEGASFKKMPSNDAGFVSLVFSGGDFSLIMEPSSGFDAGDESPKSWWQFWK